MPSEFIIRVEPKEGAIGVTCSLYFDREKNIYTFEMPSNIIVLKDSEFYALGAVYANMFGIATKGLPTEGGRDGTGGPPQPPATNDRLPHRNG